MVMIKNAAPKPYFTGFRDESGRALVAEAEQIPQHLPLYYLMTQRGPMDPQLVTNNAITLYGSKTFEERSKFFSHQTLAANVTLGAGNAVMVKRVVAPNAARAGMVFFLEIVPEDVPQYVRDVDGAVQRDASGVKLTDSTTVDGFRMRWVVEAVADIDNLRGEVKSAGTLVGRAGETSERYPIFAMAMGYGAYGNNIGLRLYFPGPNTADPADMGVVESERGMIYRAQWVERADEFSLPVVTSSIAGETTLDFALKDGMVNPKVDMDLSVARIKSEYEEIDPASGFPPVFGPIDDFYVYQDNIEDVLELLQTAEVAAGIAVEDKHMLNIFNCLDFNGNDHYSFVLDSSSVAMSASTTHYAQGGSDGDVSELVLDGLVATECTTNWENIDYPLVDHARYPFSVVYDTGFSLDTKKAIISTLRYRPDIHVGVCTQNVLERDNSISEESSILTALRAYARLIPESTIHGTPVCRVTLMGQTGKKYQSKYKNSCPLIIDLIEKRAKYMGAGDGRMKPQFAYDIAPANRITGVVEVTHPWKPDTVRSKDWELGLNWAQHANRQSLFYPALQTIYDDDTSVLNNDINMQIAVDVAKMSEEVWRQMVGNTKLSRQQFIDRCNELMLQLTDGRYDGRVTIVPNTYFTPADEARGYSWTMDVVLYMNNMPTVGTINIITRRATDLV